MLSVGWPKVYGVHVYSHLKAVIEEKECDMFTTVAWLISQGNCFYPINQTAMGRQQVGLQRKQSIEGKMGNQECWQKMRDKWRKTD